MRRLPTISAVLLAVPALSSAEVSVQYQGGRLDLKARAPLSEVLDRIGRQTGMKVVYDGAAPRTLVVADFKGLTPARAILSLLEGQNVNYAAMTDETGQKVTTLVMLGTAGGASSAASAANRPMPVAPVVSTGYDPSDAAIADDGVEEEVIEPEPEPEPEPEVAKDQKPDAPPAGIPAWGGPQNPTPFGAPPGAQPGVFSPFPQRPQPQPEAPSGDEKPEEPQRQAPTPWKP